MFKMIEKPEFWAPVTPRLPGGEEASFEAKFALLTGKEWDDGFKAEMEKPDAQYEAARAAMLGRVMLDWKDVTGPDGHQVPFDRKRLAALCEHMWFAEAVAAVYVNEITGRAARKN